MGKSGLAESLVVCTPTPSSQASPAPTPAAFATPVLSRNTVWVGAGAACELLIFGAKPPAPEILLTTNFSELFKIPLSPKV
jgi:hypothetical protein